MIYLYLLALFIALTASFNFFNPYLFKRKITYKNETTQIFKKSLSNYLDNIFFQIQKFKTKNNLYMLSEFEQERRSNYLERYYTRDIKMDYKRFNAIQTLKTIVVILMSIIAIMINNKFNVTRDIILYTFIGGILLYINFFKYRLIEADIERENDVLNANFGDFFLNQYKILINTKKKPIEKGFQANKILTKDPIMLKFINNSLFLIQSEGESVAIEKLIKWYSNIYYLNKLLIIEQQIIRGASGTQDLMSMREDVLKDREDKIEERCYQIIKESNYIVWAAMFMTIQVCIGALAYVVQQSGIFK